MRGMQSIARGTDRPGRQHTLRAASWTNILAPYHAAAARGESGANCTRQRYEVLSRQKGYPHGEGIRLAVAGWLSWSPAFGKVCVGLVAVVIWRSPQACRVIQRPSGEICCALCWLTGATTRRKRLSVI